MKCSWIAAALAVALAPAAAHAGQATCSNPGLPLGAAASSELMPGRLTLNLTSALLPIASSEVVDETTGPVRNDSRLTLVETRLSAEYALSPWLAVGFAAPYRIVDVGLTQRDPGTGMTVMGSTIHERPETLRGFGDASISAHVARELGAFRLHVRVGTSLPLGETHEDPHALGAIGQEHEHIQLGTGTFVPFVSIEAQRAIAPVTLAAWGLAQPSLYQNGDGYRAPGRFSGGVTAASGFGLRAWTFTGAIEGHGETAERWNGMVYTDEGNAGRFDLMAGADIAWRATDAFAVTASVRVPVASAVSGTQLDYGVIAAVGLVGTLDVGRRRASWHGLDERTVGPAGAAPDLVPERGRITVFDLWAEWCPPCRELDRALADLARAHPDQLAIRKLDIIDTDSAAAKRYLAPGHFDLPHVKVYAADGTLLFERSAPVHELVHAIEAALAR